MRCELIGLIELPSSQVVSQIPRSNLKGEKEEGGPACLRWSGQTRLTEIAFRLYTGSTRTTSDPSDVVRPQTRPKRVLNERSCRKTYLLAATSDGLQPTSDGLYGLQPKSDGLQPRSCMLDTGQ